MDKIRIAHSYTHGRDVTDEQMRGYIERKKEIKRAPRRK